LTLKTYRQKRNFKLTPEPTGKTAVNKKSKKLYLIQKHAASHLHYDFRLELKGVLLSWAIPKGPSLDPSIKRLALHVEDHPIEYGSFEGIIPQGQYGGGTVMLWDKGEWICDDSDALKAYKEGNLTFVLKAEKLKGKWKLIRIKKDDKAWLLIKINDEYARRNNKLDILLAEPNSVITHRSLEDIENYNKPTKKNKVVKKKLNSSETIKKQNPKAPPSKAFYNLTHPNKILYPEEKITKRELAEYYGEIEEWILPYITYRPLTFVRCPGNYNKCFYQKHIANNELNGLYSAIIKEKSGENKYIYIKDYEGLMALPQLNVLEIHPWESQIKNIEHPDMLVFDLDPGPEVPWKKVMTAAFEIKEILHKYKLRSFVKTTGGKGLHVVIPILPEYEWEDVKIFSRALVDCLVANNKKDYIEKMSKASRKHKIFIDYLRNQRGATSIAPYSTRAKKYAPVATPIEWDELTSDIKDTFFTIETLPNRLKKITKDPWKDFFKIRQSLHLQKR
jgi:bifunctional non-homologous end joining protein LigD